MSPINALQIYITQQKQKQKQKQLETDRKLERETDIIDRFVIDNLSHFKNNNNSDTDAILLFYLMLLTHTDIVSKSVFKIDIDHFLYLARDLAYTTDFLTQTYNDIYNTYYIPPTIITPSITQKLLHYTNKLLAILNLKLITQ
jgi:hypothetical protein